MIDWSLFALPVGAVALGGLCAAYAWWESRAYDKKYPPHLRG